MMRTLPLVYVPATLLDATASLLATFAAAEPAEGVVYWFGLELGASAVVTSLIVPDADASRERIVTSAAANAQALSAVVGTPLVLIGQAHSHPRADVRHSPFDDRATYAQFDGALSVVVPFFGRRGMELASCGVHRFCNGRYELISSADVPRHLSVLPGIADFRPAGQGAKRG